METNKENIDLDSMLTSVRNRFKSARKASTTRLAILILISMLAGVLVGIYTEGSILVLIVTSTVISLVGIKVISRKERQTARELDLYLMNLLKDVYGDSIYESVYTVVREEMAKGL